MIKTEIKSDVGLLPKPDFILKNGDRVVVGFVCLQALNGQLIKVINWIEPIGKLYYIKPGTSFTYKIK